MFPVCQKIEISSVWFSVHSVLTCSCYIDAVWCVLPVTNGSEVFFFCLTNQANSPEK